MSDIRGVGMRREWPKRKSVRSIPEQPHSEVIRVRSSTRQWRYSKGVTVWQQGLSNDDLGVEVKADESWPETESCRGVQPMQEDRNGMGINLCQQQQREES